MCNSEMDLGLEASKYKNPRFDIVSRIAYLLGVSEEYFLGEESNFDETIYTGLEECKDARIGPEFVYYSDCITKKQWKNPEFVSV